MREHRTSLTLFGTLIVNGSAGVIFSWREEPLDRNGDGIGNGTYNNRLTAISASGIDRDVIVNIPDKQPQSDPWWEIRPVLQKEDGTVYGTLTHSDVDTQQVVQQALISFDQSGNLTTVATGNYQPKIATQDGGVIAQASDGSTVAFGTNLSLSGLTNLPVQSWMGYAYQLGSLASVVFSPVELAASFWALQGGNQSGNSTAVQPTEYPPLKSCYATDNPSPPPCPGPRQVIWNAYKAPAIENPINSAPAILTSNATQLQTYVFNKLSGPNGSVYREGAFVAYMRRGFSPYDGTKSTAPLSVVGVSPLQRNGQVKDDFLSDPSLDAETIPSKAPQEEAAVATRALTVFFNPSNFDTSNFGANTFNMAMTFHEGLHGFTGMDDFQLQGALGCSVQFNSLNITDYVEQFLFTPPPTNVAPCQ